jgi:hypothetical protein
MPRLSVFSACSSGVATCTRKKDPYFSTVSLAACRDCWKGAIGAAMAAAPALVSSAATKAMRAMFLSRSSREKPSSEESSERTVSPRRSETGRPPCWFSVTLRARAMASLPEFWYPVRKTVKPCWLRGGCDSRRTRTTSGYENHSGISWPVRRRLRSSDTVSRVHAGEMDGSTYLFQRCPES